MRLYHVRHDAVTLLRNHLTEPTVIETVRFLMQACIWVSLFFGLGGLVSDSVSPQPMFFLLLAAAVTAVEMAWRGWLMRAVWMTICFGFGTLTYFGIAPSLCWGASAGSLTVWALCFPLSGYKQIMDNIPDPD